MGHPPFDFLLHCLVWETTRFILWHDGDRQLASLHWQACTRLWMQRVMAFLRSLFWLDLPSELPEKD